MPILDYDTDFQTKYTIRPAAYEGWEFKKPGFSRLNPWAKARRVPKDFVAAEYGALKYALETDFSNIQKQYPEFKPKVKFNDDALTIDIGYTDKEFDVLFTSESALRKVKLKYNLVYERPSFIENDIEKLERASGFFRDSPIPTSVPAPEIKLPEDISSSEVIAHIIESQKNKTRLVVGEVHDNVSARLMLMKALPEMARHNIPLCMEHINHETMQPLLDQWAKAPNPNQPMPYELERYIRQIDRNHSRQDTGFALAFKDKNFVPLKDVLVEAKRSGVPIIAIDSEVAYAIKSPPGNKVCSRCMVLNHVAADVIRMRIGDGSFVALVGNAHVGNLSDGEKTSIGLAQQLGANGIIIEDSKSNRILKDKETIRSYKEASSKLSVEADMAIRQDPTAMYAEYKDRQAEANSVNTADPSIEKQRGIRRERGTNEVG
jgi:hypothetical protein